MIPGRVSIIVRSQGNRPALLRAAIASVAAQTHPNMELVLAEDGEGSLKDLAAEVSAAGRLAVIHRYALNRNRCRTANMGLEAMSGEFFCFLDDDDELEPRHSELLVAALLAQPPADAITSYSRRIRLDSIDKPVRLPGGKLRGVKRFSRADLAYSCSLRLEATLFRRSLYERAGGMDETLEAYEDWDLFLRYAALTDFAVLPEVTAICRFASDATIRRRRSAAYHNGFAQVVAKHADMPIVTTPAEIRALCDRWRHKGPAQNATAGELFATLGKTIWRKVAGRGM